MYKTYDVTGRRGRQERDAFFPSLPDWSDQDEPCSPVLDSVSPSLELNKGIRQNSRTHAENGTAKPQQNQVQHVCKKAFPFHPTTSYLWTLCDLSFPAVTSPAQPFMTTHPNALIVPHNRQGAKLDMISRRPTTIPLQKDKNVVISPFPFPISPNASAASREHTVSYATL